MKHAFRNAMIAVTVGWCFAFGMLAFPASPLDPTTKSRVICAICAVGCLGFGVGVFCATDGRKGRGRDGTDDKRFQ